MPTRFPILQGALAKDRILKVYTLGVRNQSNKEVSIATAIARIPRPSHLAIPIRTVSLFVFHHEYVERQQTAWYVFLF